MINDTSQRSVATLFRCHVVEYLTITLLQIYF